MKLRHVTATVAAVGALGLISVPLAGAAPAPKADPNFSRAVPGASCTVGQLRSTLDRTSPGLLKRLDEAAGGPKQFADIATSDPLTRQFRVAALAFQGSGIAFGLANDQAEVQRAVAEAYRTCSKAIPAKPAKHAAK